MHSLARSTNKYRIPNSQEEWRRVKWSTMIETPVHYELEAEKITIQMVREDIIKEAIKETTYCSLGFFNQKPNDKGQRVVTDYRQKESINRVS